MSHEHNNDEMNHEIHGAHDTHDKHSMHMGHHSENFKKMFIISVLLTIPLLLLSDTIQSFFHFTLYFKGKRYVEFVLATILYFYCGSPFLTGAFTEIKNKAIGMMTLISISITCLYFYSVAVNFGFNGGSGMTYGHLNMFWELGLLITIMLLGHWIEMRSIMNASQAVETLAKLLPNTATKVVNGKNITIALDDVHKDDILLVRANEKVPTDGVIINGETYIDESLLTGESQPVKRVSNDNVIGGSINGAGAIMLRVTGVGSQSYLANVVHIVQEAQADKSQTQNLADKAAKWLAYIALSVALITLIVWYFLSRDWTTAILMMSNVLIIACPHALGLAIPLVVANSISRVAQKGVLIRNRTAFENCSQIKVVVFDKTGTLTEGHFTVSDIIMYDKKFKKEKVLQYAASLEQLSEHPIAHAITQYALDGLAKGTKLLPVTDFHSLTAKGVEGKIKKEHVQMMSPSALQEIGINFPDTSKAEQTIVCLVIDKQLIAIIALADKIRPNAKKAVEELHAQNIQVMMATGDVDAVAKTICHNLGLDNYYAELQPEQKFDILADLQAHGLHVAMVGDGINDAPALAKADLGIAIGSGTAVANETADIILVNNNPEDVPKVLKWGKLTKRKMIQNLVWAFAYNVVGIPIATGFFYPLVINPMFSAIVMSLSTIIVAINAQLLLKEIK